MRIDGRKSSQDFTNRSSGKRIYCHKTKSGYSIGINGTSHHASASDKHIAEQRVRELVSLQIKTY